MIAQVGLIFVSEINETDLRRGHYPDYQSYKMSQNAKRY